MAFSFWNKTWFSEKTSTIRVTGYYSSRALCHGPVVVTHCAAFEPVEICQHHGLEKSQSQPVTEWGAVKHCKGKILKSLAGEFFFKKWL